MATAWQILRDAGLPLAIEGTHAKPPDSSSIATAMRAAIAEEPVGRDAEALAAFVFAWQQHWPSSFAQEVGASSTDILEWARSHVLDEGRYVKLRRIAIENLSRIL